MKRKQHERDKKALWIQMVHWDVSDSHSTYFLLGSGVNHVDLTQTGNFNRNRP